MGRILGLDFGEKRCGLAVTDELQIAVHPLIAIERTALDEYLNAYVEAEDVEALVVGMPYHADGSRMAWTKKIDDFVSSFQSKYPNISVHYQDESYTSAKAAGILAQSPKKKTRRSKAKLDILSAVLILQQFLKHI